MVASIVLPPLRSLHKDLEFESRFNQPPELAKGLAVEGPLAQGAAQINQRRGHRDVIRHLDLVPPLPDKVAIVWRGRSGQGRCKHGLGNGHAKVITLGKNIGPLQAHHPRFTAVDSVEAVDGGPAPP